MEQHPEAGGLAVATRRTYAIVIEWAETNYAAYVPDVPGCVTTGATVEETIANMREALQAHLEVTQEYGEPLPEPRAHVATVDVAIESGGPTHTAPTGGTMPVPYPEIQAEEYEPLDREQEMAWLAAHAVELAVYAGQWFALVGQQIAHAATLRELRALTQEQGYADPLMVAVPPRDAAYR